MKRDRIALGFVLLCLVALGPGCKSDDEFVEMMNTGHFLFEGQSEETADITCKYDLQTVFFNAQPLDTFLHAQITNGTDQPITLNQSKDAAYLVINMRRRYNVDLSTSVEYPASILAGRHSLTRFQIHSPSLLTHVRKREVKLVDFEIDNQGETVQCIGVAI